MFAKRTVFIVGAGASAEYDLPTGDKLKAKIAADLRFRFDFNRQVSGNADLLRMLHQEYPKQSNIINEYTKSGNELSEAIHAFISIDEALHYFSGREEIIRLGKLAAAVEILRAERHSSLINRETGQARTDISSETWLPSLLSMALGSLTKAQVDDAFANITIVNFNYDRTIEHYLYFALQNIAGLPADGALNSISRLTMLRPYGSLGPLNWTHQQHGVKFGGEQYQSKPFSIAEGIRTYTEQRIESDLADQIKDAMAKAATIVFLGFGFHQQNMRLFEQKKSTKIENVFATVLGIHEENHSVIFDRLRSILKFGGSPNLQNMRGGEMLQKLRPSLSLAVST